MVHYLEKANLVDRRGVLLKLTPSGEAMLDELASRHLEEMLKQEPHLSSTRPHPPGWRAMSA
jgi:DNA-binding MarR family transcriptional regulator